MERDTRPQEDLAFIRRMMEDSRRLVRNDGSELLRIGAACVLGTGASYLLPLVGAQRFIPWMWIALVVLIASMFVFRGWRRDRPRSAAGSFVGTAWLTAIAAGASILAGGAAAGKIDIALAMGITSACVGAGYAFTAYAARSVALGALSVFWWIGAAILPSLGEFTAPAVLAGLTFLLEVVPGLVMKLRSRRAEKR